MTELDREERELLRSVETGEWKPVRHQEQEIERYREVARSTFKKDRRVHVQLSSKDLEALKKRALREGVPYQTLISSILHKYVSGYLREEMA